MKQFLLGLFIIYAYFICGTAYCVEHYTNLNHAVAEARQDELNVLIIFSIDGCVHCDKLKADIDNNLIPVDRNYVLCLIDSQDQKKLSRKFHIKRWPTSVVVQPSDVIELRRLVGYKSIDSYNSWLNYNLNNK